MYLHLYKKAKDMESDLSSLKLGSTQGRLRFKTLHHLGSRDLTLMDDIPGLDAAPKFQYLIAPSEDPDRSSLPAELRDQIFSMVLTAKVRRDLRICLSKVVMLASRGCAEYQENPIWQRGNSVLCSLSTSRQVDGRYYSTLLEKPCPYHPS